MNSKFFPSGLKPVNKFATWFNHEISPVIPEGKRPENWIQLMIRNSNWFTNLADAHVKIYEDYQKLESEGDYLGIIENLKSQEEELNFSYNAVPGRVSVNGASLTDRFGKASPIRGLDESSSL
jgi:hypothetical protein